MSPIRKNLVALGSTAVIAVYAAGFARTKDAADKFAAADAERMNSTAEGVQNSALASPISKPTETEDQLGNTVRTPNALTTPERSLRQSDTSSIGSTAESNQSRPDRQADAMASKVDIEVPPPPAKQVDSNSVVIAVNTPLPASTTTPVQQPATLAPDTTGPKRGPYKDGKFSGWGTSRHGDIEATVEIKDGNIISAAISQCRTRYSCSVISGLPPQVIARQAASVDYVSGATQSTGAYRQAIAEALSQAK